MQQGLELREKKSRKARLKEVVFRIFNDDVMIGLAVILAGVVVLQLFFEFSPAMKMIFHLNFAQLGNITRF